VKTSLLVLLLIVQGQHHLLWVDAFPLRVANNRIHHPLRTCHSHLEKSSHLPSSRRRRTDVLQIQRPTPSNVVTYASVPSCNDFAAGGTLLLSSMIGILSEKLNFKGGHVITLLTAAILSNTSRVVPTDHILYDLCWSIFLPASLVLALLSTSSTSEELTGSSTSSATEISSNVNNSILGMALPFAAGSIGSVIGCCVSFFLCKFHDVKATAILAGCLCASYIGGTVNFFAAAKILMPMFKCDSSSGRDGGIGSLFGSLAAADLVVMAIYFAVLSFASKSTLLQRLFPNRNDDDENLLSISNNDVMAPSDSVVSDESLRESSRKDSTIYASLGSTITAVIWAFLVSLLTVLAATDLEKRVNNLVPGTMCAFLALFGLMSERLVGIGLNRNQKRSSKSFLARSLEKVPLVSPALSSMCFYLLFASIGTTADVTSAVASGPTALVFASLALAIHFVTVLVATFLGGRLSRRTKIHHLPTTLQEMLTASNAAIGGPSTAAAFAADLVPITPSSRANSQLRRSLVLGATFWGVFGYAIGTATGVSLTKALMRWV